MGKRSTSSVYTLVRNHAIVYDDVNRLVLSCTGPFQVYRILRDLENHVLCTGMNWYVHVYGGLRLYIHLGVRPGKISLLILTYPIISLIARSLWDIKGYYTWIK